MRARHDAASALPERSAAADPKRQETATVIPQNRFVMEELTLTTPALLFSAVSLILLAYTNRFLSYAQLVRTLKEQHLQHPSKVTRAQIDNLRRRLHLTRTMQILGFSLRGDDVPAVCRIFRPFGLCLRRGVAAADRFAGRVDLGNPDFGPRPRNPPARHGEIAVITKMPRPRVAASPTNLLM